MKFVINREHILGPLSRVCKIIEQRPTLPLLSHCHMRVEKGKMTLTGSRIEVEVSETINDVNAEDLVMAFPADSVLKFINRLPEQSNLVFEQIDANELLISLASETAATSENSFRTKIHDTDDFPRINPDQWALNFQVNRSEFADLLRRTSFSMAKDQLRYFLNAMVFEIGDNKFRAVATDAHRLATAEIDITSSNGNSHRAIVSRKSVLDLMRLLPELVSSITVRLSSSHICISTPQVQFVSKLLEGQYPDWRAVIPTNLSRSFDVNRDELATVFGRVSILIESETVPLGAKMMIGNNAMKVHAENPIQQIDATIPVEYDSEPFNLEVNCKYIIDVVNAMHDAEKIQFSYRNAESACKIENPTDRNATYLVMLMKG